jgi:tetratricopeptide (TPR) repeat protein
MVTNGGWVTEKGMVIASINLDIEMNGLELAEIFFPDYLYIPYARADILAYKGKKKEAMAILEKIIAANPDANPVIPENRSFQRAAKELLSDLQQGKRY